ncbi:MAG: RIP metalloprotease RseP [Bdellovibrionales bacterium]|nr:RIP metalloprotease RseP [Bdellovibrionales bacterium]
MEMIQSFLHQSVGFLIPLVILLGALIFVHELGHFLVAKYYKVKVEVFSLGFGKKLIQYKHGDTVYCLSLIPFGGYVKMYGENPADDISEENKKVSFLHKPVGQRIAIVLAGPLMNLLFAFVLFSAIAEIGDLKALPVVGQVQPYTEVAEFGIQPGDKILSVNGDAIANWDEYKLKINSAASDTVTINYENYLTEETKSVSLKLKTIKNPNILSFKDTVRTVDGLDIVTFGTSIGVADLNSSAFKSGLRTGDRIVKFQDKEVSRWYEIEKILAANTSLTLKLLVERTSAESKTPEEIEFILPSETVVTNLNAVGIERPDLYVGIISPGSAAEKAGLQVADKFIEINSKPLKYWNDLTNSISAYSKETGPLNVSILRNGKKETILITPAMLTQENPMTGKKEESLKIGVGPILTMVPPPTQAFPARSFSESILTGIEETNTWVVSTVVGFVRLFQNKVSAKSIGGPIMIGQIASESFKIGLVPFLKIMAIISINLFIINLLPIPVLDGGHLVLFTIEAVKGAPVSMRKVAIAQQIGFFLLLFLMVFAMFNDISRVLGS